MKLTDEKINNLKKCMSNRALHVDDLLDTIEAQQQEIENYFNLVSEDNVHMKKLYGAMDVQQQEIVELRAELETTKHIARAQTEAAIDYQAQVEQLQAQEKNLREWLNGYHNPADVEALRVARVVLNLLDICGGLGYERHERIRKVLEQIDKAGGGQDD